MSDMKTCPFCLEEIPVRAIKCRYCESMIEEGSPAAIHSPESGKPAAKKQKKRYDTPQQGVYYQAISGNGKGKRLLVPLIIIVALLVALSAGAGYWFLIRDNDARDTGEIGNGDVLGSWKNSGESSNVYFQFLPNEMVNVAVPSEG